jgi:hypothetical protein
MTHAPFLILQVPAIMTHAPFLILQVPAIMTHAPFLDPCTNGAGYSLLIVVPGFYLLSAVLFAILGTVIVYWNSVRDSKELSYDRIEDTKDTKEVESVPP